MTLASASTLSSGLADEIKNIKGVEAAKRVGLNLAQKLVKKRTLAMSSSIVMGFSSTGA